MIIKYNIEKIRKILYDFHNITGLTVSVWDTEMHRLGYEPCIMPDFCRLIRTSPEGERRCLKSDLNSLCKACDTLMPSSNLCHAGIIDTAIPIISGGKLFGYMMFGQVQGHSDTVRTMEDMEKLGEELGLSPQELYEAYNRLTFFDVDKINSAAHILSAATGFLFDSSSIEYTEHELVDKINDYISKNLSLSFSVADLCSLLGISKKRLYSVWNRHFDITVGKYVLKKRMERAKEMLSSSDRKIKDICADVGICDYNYFTKIFKKYYGTPPRDYRKTHLK